MRRDDDRAGNADDRIPEDEDTRLDREHLQRLRRARQARVAKLLVALSLVVIFIIFIIGNADQKEIDFVFVESRVPLIWVMLGCSIVGGIVGFAIGRPGRQFRFHRRDRDDDRDRDRKRR